MKIIRFTAIFAVVAFSYLAFAVATPNPADFPETVHVTSSQLVFDGGTAPGQRLWVEVTGKKYELLGNAILAEVHVIGGVHPGVLPIGDYKGRLITNTTYKPDYLLFLSYEILLPDGKTAKFNVVGESE